MSKRSRQSIEDDTAELDEKMYCILDIKDALQYDIKEVRKCSQKAIYLSELLDFLTRISLEKNDDRSPISKKNLRILMDRIGNEYWMYPGSYAETFPYNISQNWTLHTILWCILCKLYCIYYEYNSYYGPAPYMVLYGKQTSGYDVKYAHQSKLALPGDIVRDFTVNQLLRALYWFTILNNKIEYTQDLSVWLNMLILRQAQLLYGKGTRDIYNSIGYCEKISDEEEDDESVSTEELCQWTVNSLFVEECARVIFDLRSSHLNYMFYDRNAPFISEIDLNMSQVLLLPLYNVEDDHKYIRIMGEEHFIQVQPNKTREDIKAHDGYFIDQRLVIFNDKKYNISYLWEFFVLKKLIPHYTHDHQEAVKAKGYKMMLVPGEYKRWKQRGCGQRPFTVLQKSRPANTITYITNVAFQVTKEQLFKRVFSLSERFDPIDDAYFIVIMNSYLDMAFNIKFEDLIHFEDYVPLSESLAKYNHPVIVQLMGGWDVYDMGVIYHCRGLARALLVLIIIIKNKYDCMIEGYINLYKFINSILEPN